MKQMELQEKVDALEARVAVLEAAVEGLAKSSKPSKRSGRVWTDQQREAAGYRLQTARAIKVGLESAEQLRSLKLRPGETPTKAQILEAKKRLPVLKTTKIAKDPVDTPLTADPEFTEVMTTKTAKPSAE